MRMANPLPVSQFEDVSVGLRRFPHAVLRAPLVDRAFEATSQPPIQDLSKSCVQVLPESAARCLVASWRGLRGEMKVTAPFHLLICYERAVRRQGETMVENLPPSDLHDFSQKMTFVPAGHRFVEWQEPSKLFCATFLFIDPATPPLNSEGSFKRGELAPRLFFENSILRETVRKLRAVIEVGGEQDRLYAEALGVVLMHELICLADIPASANISIGGLASWQRRLVVRYIEENLARPISLCEIAAVAKLSPYHFARAFKTEFGVPPHRYHAQRRIERAKISLAQAKQSITDIALDLGFSGASSFSRTFHKVTGQTPRSYRRCLI
jgi:AraC family transcriptional regulator